MKRLSKAVWTCILILQLVLLAGCRQQSGAMDEGNAIYYWRTDLRLDSTEQAFLKQYHINKVYCRYFDVVMGDDGKPRPNATVTFSDTLPDGIELVPTIYITEDCMHQRHEDLADKVVSRILQMNETNNVSGIREIQIDCDYTARSRKNYYDFLKAVANCSLFTIHYSLLSTTIRLHQLSMPAPPVDYGQSHTRHTRCGTLSEPARRLSAATGCCLPCLPVGKEHPRREGGAHRRGPGDTAREEGCGEGAQGAEQLHRHLSLRQR